jgi:hypothetical protein
MSKHNRERRKERKGQPRERDYHVTYPGGGSFTVRGVYLGTGHYPGYPDWPVIAHPRDGGLAGLSPQDPHAVIREGGPTGRVVYPGLPGVPAPGAGPEPVPIDAYSCNPDGGRLTLDDLREGEWFTFVPEREMPPDWTPPVWVKLEGKFFRERDDPIPGKCIGYGDGSVVSVRRAGRAVIYQVDLYGPYAEAARPGLTDMVETNCCGCGVILLAEGEGFRGAMRQAREGGGLVWPICAGCYRRPRGISGPLGRGVPDDPYHEEEFAAMAARWRAGTDGDVTG